MIHKLIPYKTGIILILFMAVACSVNLGKAVHIDDTAYLQIAKAILVSPLHPLSQKIMWGNTARPIFVINQPLLIPYIYAILIKLFGPSELILHLFMALCSSLVILFFYILVNSFHVRYPLFLTGLFSLGPSFLPGQNLMVDIPLIVSWLVFFWAILSTEGEDRKYLLAGIAVSIACLIKYTSLVLLPVFLIVIIYRRHWRGLWGFGIILLTLLLWSIFNYYDFGAIHLLGRPTVSLTPQTVFYRLISWICGIGSIAPFIISFISLKRDDLRDRNWIMVSILCSILLGLFMIFTDQTTFAIYWIPFFIIGLFLNGFAVSLLKENITVAWRDADKNALVEEIVLGLWIVGLTRQGIVIWRDVLSFSLTILLGIALAISDYTYANVYRHYAYSIKQDLPSNERVYEVGFWGWAWYSTKAGMLQYDMKQSSLQADDYLVIPTNISKQRISKDDLSRLNRIRDLQIPAPWTTWIRTMYGGGYYSFAFPLSPPWRFSKAPFEFEIYQVDR